MRKIVIEKAENGFIVRDITAIVTQTWIFESLDEVIELFTNC